MGDMTRADYVERWGLLMEANGQQRLAGQIFAQVVTSGEQFVTLQQLAEQLGVSKASISIHTRRLVADGMLTRIALPDSREMAYAANTAAMREVLSRFASVCQQYQALADEGLELAPDTVTPGTQTLRLMSDVYGEMARNLLKLSTYEPRRTRAAKRSAR